MAKVDILNYISDSNILRSTYDTDTNELDITDIPQNLNSVITLGQAQGSDTFAEYLEATLLDGDYETSATLIKVGYIGSGVSTNFRFFAPNVTSLATGTFRSISKVTEAYFPSLTSMSDSGAGNQFMQSTSIKTADLGLVEEISSQCFSSASNFETLILRKTDALQKLKSINSISNGTKFKNGGTGGTVYIPEALYDHLGDGSSLDYQSATNWSTIYAYGTITWAKLEGSQYEDPTWWRS